MKKQSPTTRQSRLEKIIDEIGYNLHELAEKLKEDGNNDLSNDMSEAANYLAIFMNKLEENKYDFGRNVEIWIECREEWNDAAWNYIKSQDND